MICHDYKSRWRKQDRGAVGFSPRGRSHRATFSLCEEPRGLKPTARRAFSLLELMIATIILGFGLLMIGAVLPIAWKGSV